MNIIVLFVLIVLIVTIIWNTIHKRSVKIKNEMYPWCKILWPFDKTPFLLYKHLSPDNKGAFWNLTSNIFICIITFWAGITLQLYINNEGQRSSERLTRYQIIDKFYPDYQQCVDSCSGVYSMLQHAADEKNKNGITKAESIMQNFVANDSNLKEIKYAVETAIEYNSKVLPYISSEDIANTIKTNNFKLFLGSKILSKIESISKDSTIVLVDKTFSLFSKSDSIKEVDELIKECYALESKIGHSDSIIEICQNLYSLSKAMFIKRTFMKDEESYQIMLQFVFMPMVNNRKIIEEEFFIQKPDIAWKLSWENIVLILKDIRSIAFYVLLGCLFVGYMIFRIILMRVFDRRSLTPNPLLSQNDCEKLHRKLDSEERENKQKQINEIALLTAIESLKADLISKKEQIEKIVMKQHLDLSKWEEKETEYIKEIERVHKINEDLMDRINKQIKDNIKE